jgi:EAL domain-containing protein (putative c-di-GMP-specific phosphodiesterase class I)
VAWQPEFDAGGARRLALLNDLRGGIEAGQLLACFQPKARLADGRIIACEMLIRWRHPEQGMVFPDDFIPAAEQSNLIRPLTRWVIDTAAAQAGIWRDAGREIAVGVNLSARNLADHEVVEQIANALARHQLPPSALIAEITESALMDDPETALGVVNAIAALGVKLSIDDFGAGYSSLSQLSRLPVKELKIDKAFVLRMLESEQEAAIVKSTIDLAHTLGLHVVAEGVETEAHWQRLVAYGCDVAQGYYLSKPIEVAAFDAWLAEREG